MLGLPALAVLAAFALPTLQRSAAAAIDWFRCSSSRCCAVALWVIYVAMQTGVPAKPAANVARLAPGFTPHSRWLAFVVALRGTRRLALAGALAHRAPSRTPLWKSLVLPAGGVALCWLLVMTLLLPPLDYARSYRAQVERIARQVPREAVHRRARHAARADRRPRVPRRLAVRRAPTPPTDAVRYLMCARARATARRAGPAGSSSPRERRPTDRTRSPTSTAAARRADRRLGSDHVAAVDAGVGSDAGARVAHPRRPEARAGSRALAGLALDVELAAVALHDVLDDRQARARCRRCRASGCRRRGRSARSAAAGARARCRCRCRATANSPAPSGASRQPRRCGRPSGV